MHIEHIKIGVDGRIIIPASTRRELGFQPGHTIVAESDGVSLLLRSYDAVIHETQDYFRQFAIPGQSVVDELIAERRAEAAAEANE